MMRTLATALAAAVLVLAAGCGDSQDDVTTTPADEPAASTTSAAPSDPPPPPLPTCASVWPERAALPDEYAGCRENGERVVKSVRCESGQQLFTYAGRFFAVPGGPIFSADGALADDARFQKMQRVCTA